MSTNNGIAKWFPYVLALVVGVLVAYWLDFYRHTQQVKRDQEVFETVFPDEQSRIPGFQKVDAVDEEKRLKEYQRTLFD